MPEIAQSLIPHRAGHQPQFTLIVLQRPCLTARAFSPISWTPCRETQDVRALAQLYRDRADAENVFDELKNQWGWGEYVTQDIKRCRLTAKAVALIYNWWSLFIRLAHPEARMEAITSRPLLLSGVARKTEHAGQQHLKITPMHGKKSQARDMPTRVSSLLEDWKKTAEQLDCHAVWLRVCESIVTSFTGIDGLAVG